MTKRDGTPKEAPSDQVLAAAIENVSEKKTADSSTEKVEAQPMSYRRSRDVALLKLALLRPKHDEAA